MFVLTAMTTMCAYCWLETISQFVKGEKNHIWHWLLGLHSSVGIQHLVHSTATSDGCLFS